MSKAKSERPSAKAERLNLRSTEAEKRLLERAAEASHMTVSQFVMQAATRSAEDVLVEQTRFVLSAEQWSQFVELLDRPARVIPALAAAAARQSSRSEH